MQIFIASSKTMTGGVVPRLIPGGTDAAFESNANSIAMRLSRYSVDELKGMLRCNEAIARANHFRYRRFLDPATRRPAIFSYDGMVYRKIDADTMTDADLEYANEHLLIGSFIYGLLRPLDRINPYRLEGNVELPAIGKSMFDYWKPILTDWLIARVKDDDGVLVNLASAEFKRLFDWDRVKRELTVITPEFKVEKEGKLTTVVIYAKMCRGAMIRWILDRRVTEVDELREFKYEGFEWEKGWEYVLRG